MITKEKVKIGQDLFSLNVGNAARNREQKLTPVTVIKVGRKYFTTHIIGENSDWGDKQYYIETWTEKTDFSATSMLYESPQAYLDYKEAKELNDVLREYFTYRHSNELTLETLKGMAVLLDADANLQKESCLRILKNIEAMIEEEIVKK